MWLYVCEEKIRRVLQPLPDSGSSSFPELWPQIGTDPPVLWVDFIVLVGLCIEGEGRGFAGALKDQI
jgi:hypothetical protein